MSLELTLALLVAGWIVWEIRRLRDFRHVHTNKLTALTVTVENVQSDMEELKGDMKQVRDGLIRAKIIDGGDGVPH